MKEEKESRRSVNVELIPESKSVYKTLCRIIKKYHKPLRKAKVALVWKSNVHSDKDGHLMLGRCIRVSDLYKEFMPYDFIIQLNREMWYKLDRKQQKAILDHELFHGTSALDKKGNHKKDARGRYCYRMRRHQLEEFNVIVARHGAYLPDIKKFVEAVKKRTH